MSTTPDNVPPDLVTRVQEWVDAGLIEPAHAARILARENRHGWIPRPRRGDEREEDPTPVAAGGFADGAVVVVALATLAILAVVVLVLGTA